MSPHCTPQKISCCAPGPEYLPSLEEGERRRELGCVKALLHLPVLLLHDDAVEALLLYTQGQVPTQTRLSDDNCVSFFVGNFFTVT